MEIHNVRPKDTGWLFGKADLIAFEKESSFIFVKRLDLLSVVNKKVNLVAKVHNPKDALYKIYTRDGRKDKLTLLPTSDIEEIKFMEWKKVEINLNGYEKLSRNLVHLDLPADSLHTPLCRAR